MKKITFIIVTLVMLAALAVPGSLYAVQAFSGIPTFSIVNVITDQKVTIQTDNFPAGYTFNVLMGAYGTRGIGGTNVGTAASGSGGAMQFTFTIPAALKGADRIAIRMESTTGGFFAYNWFWNNTSSGGTVGPVYTGIPTFSIQSVVMDSQVTIKAYNFPQNYDFKVLMGAYGTLGIGGTQVATTNSETGATFTVTYNIPASLKGAARIAIRMESTTGGFFAYNWFWNNTGTTGSTSTGGTGGPIYTGIPTFAITAVVKDSKVTIKTNNFPKNYDFQVLMGNFGTAGVGGTLVGTTNSGTGGTFTVTYDIPASMQGKSRIAIRMQSTTGGFFAYNWFWNTTTP